MIAILLLYLILLFLVGKYTLFANLSWNIDKILNFSVRNWIISFFDCNYSNEISNFLKLIILNVKDKAIYNFYKSTIDLGIAWLICVSGFHLQLITKIIFFLFSKKIKNLTIFLNTFILFFYCYLLDFSYSSTRVLLSYVIIHSCKKIKFKQINLLGIVGLIFCFFNSCCFENFSFLLTISSCYGVYYVLDLAINNSTLKKLFISLYVNLLILPIIALMNNKISLMVIFNSFIFSYIFIFIYSYFIIFSWFPFLYFFHDKLINLISYLINCFTQFNFFLKIPKINDQIIVIYFLILIIISRFIINKWKYII